MNKIRLTSIILTLIIIGVLGYFSPLKKKEHSGPLLGAYKILDYSRPESNEKYLSSKIKFLSGELNIFPLENRNIYEFNALYKFREVKPLLKFTPGEKAGLDIMLKRHHRIGLSARSYWKLGLSTNAVHDLSIEAKACRQNLDFTYIPIKSLFLKTGASKINVYFNEPNKTIMESFTVDTGASDCHIYRLTNANSKNTDIHFGTGFYTLDFSGTQQVSSNVNIDGVITKAKLVIPENINCKIKFRDKLLTSFNISPKFIKRSKTEYVSKNFDPHAKILNIKICLGTGHLSIVNQ